MSINKANVRPNVRLMEFGGNLARVTLKDVAAKAGVSYQTVSKVLNKKANVSAETEARIMAAINELDYKPDISARNLRTGSSNLIGYAWRLGEEDVTHPILDRFLSSAAQVVEKHNYHLLTFLIGQDDYDVSTYETLFARKQVRGFILADTNHNDARIEYLIKNNIPFASFGRANDSWDYCWADVDGRYGLKSIVNHLVSRGHQRIGLISWPAGSRSGDERFQGYLDGLTEANLQLDQDLIVYGSNTTETGFRAVTQMLALPDSKRPTAVACFTDAMAVGAMNAVRAAGLTVGKDVAITGYDDDPMAEYLHPTLTSVRQPIPRIGQVIVDLLHKQINGEPIQQKGHLLKPEIMIRQSS